MSLSIVPNRVYAQYQGKPNIVRWMNFARDLGKSIDNSADKVALSYDVDAASGELLNILGRIVGIDRNFINKIEVEVFEFGDGDCECGDENVMFSPPNVASDSAMSDGLFKLLIKAKILKNNRSATIEDIIEQMVLLVGVDFLRVNNPENMTFSIEFAGNLTPLQRYALFNENIIQIPQGVLFNGFLELTDLYEFNDADAQFGDDEVMFSDFGGNV